MYVEVSLDVAKSLWREAVERECRKTTADNGKLGLHGSVMTHYLGMLAERFVADVTGGTMNLSHTQHGDLGHDVVVGNMRIAVKGRVPKPTDKTPDLLIGSKYGERINSTHLALVWLWLEGNSVPFTGHLLGFASTEILRSDKVSRVDRGKGPRILVPWYEFTMEGSGIMRDDVFPPR